MDRTVDLRANLPMLENLEGRLLLAADLAVSIVSGTGPDVLVPGDKGSITVHLANVGDTAAAGMVNLAINGSTDTTLDLADPLFGSLTGKKINLAPGAGVDVKINLTVPAAATPGDYYMLATATSTLTSPDTNAANDQAATAGTEPVVWQFGAVGSRTNVKLVLADAGGPVTFALTGPGTGEVTPSGGAVSFQAVDVTGSTTASSMAITTAKGETTTIDNITVEGSIKAITAPTTNMTDDVRVHGLISTLSLHDAAAGGVTVTLNSDGLAVPTAATAAITVHLVDGFNLDTNGIPLKSFTAANVGDNVSISAPWISAITVKSATAGQGNFGATLDLGQDAKGVSLGKMTVSGALDGTDILGAGLGAITAGGQWVGGSISASSLKSLTVGGNMTADATITDTGAVKVGGDLSLTWTSNWIKSISVGGNMTGSDIELVPPAQPSTRVNLGSLSVTGWMTNSQVIAGDNLTIGTVTAGGMDTSKVLAGVVGTNLPGSLAALGQAHPGAIKSFAVKGIKGAGGSIVTSFINSDVAAWTIGSAAFCFADAFGGGTTFGFVSHSIAKLTYRHSFGTVRSSSMTTPADSISVGDLVISIL